MDTMHAEGRVKATAHWFVLKSRYTSLPFREPLKSAGMEYFLPTYFSFQNVGGRKVRVERALVFNFIFVHAVVNEVKDFVKHNDGLSLVYRHRAILDNNITPEQQLLIVPDKEMNMFIRTVGQYSSEIPFFRPSELDLEKGDHVRILEGAFAGVEGVLVSQQGKDGGRVMVSISDFLAVPTLDIRPEHLEIISFAPVGKHMYKKFDSFILRARKALQHHRSSLLDDADRGALQIFLRRFSSLETPTVNMRLKLLVYQLICHTCLGNIEDASQTESTLVEQLSMVNSDTNRAFAFVYLYGCTANVSYAGQAQALITQWGTPAPREKMKLMIIEDLQMFAASAATH